MFGAELFSMNEMLIFSVKKIVQENVEFIILKHLVWLTFFEKTKHLVSIKYV